MSRRWTDAMWYEGAYPLLGKGLRFFSWFFRVCSALRAWYLKAFSQKKWSVPIIVIGNITVGGVGKTPLVIALAQQLQAKGLRVGIVSRGYGAQVGVFPYAVQLEDSALKVGDEPLLLARKTLCPVVIAPKRNEAVAYLLENYQSQIILSDDGLQHYRMGRALEIVVVDGSRGVGNGLCLPAGPLRESVSRLAKTDFIVVNGPSNPLLNIREEAFWDEAYSMQLKAASLRKLLTDEVVSTETFVNKTIAAVAGIGNPSRFYETLRLLGMQFITYTYPDHYQFTSNDLNYHESMVIMTEKDAVKCKTFACDKLYYLPVEAVLPAAFWDALWLHPVFRRVSLL